MQVINFTSADIHHLYEYSVMYSTVDDGMTHRVAIICSICYIIHHHSPASWVLDSVVIESR